MAAQFEYWLISQGLSKKSIQNTLSRLDRLEVQGALTEEGFYTFLSTLRKDYSAALVNKYVDTIRKYITFTKVQWNHLPSRIKEHNRSPETISDEEINLILAHLNPKYRFFFTLLAHTGLRPSEALKLDHTCFDLARNVICIRDTKTFKDRVIPIHEALTPFIKTVITGKQFNFSDTAARTELNKVCGELQITRKKIYAFRHSFVTRLLDSDVDLFSVKLLAGHSDTRSTERYYHSSLKRLKVAIQKDALGFVSMPWTKKLQIIAIRLKEALEAIKNDPDIDYSVTETNEEIIIRVKKKDTKK